jgi:D-alanyl-lipoteichoic acid acyltransferase DltB (MBOAT superfamily)
MRNFEQPYLSTNISQFWRTWHISLSTWLWDYLYVPLGGNRSGWRRTYINLMLTMLIGGLWHGAAWTFVVWGGLHGLFLSAHRAFGAYEARGKPVAPRLRDFWKVAITFHAVGFAWVFFRADSVRSAVEYLVGFRRVGSLSAGDAGLASQAVVVFTMMAAAFALDWIDRNRERYQPLASWSPIPLGIAMAIMVAGLLVFSGGTTVPFIYFQF